MVELAFPRWNARRADVSLRMLRLVTCLAALASSAVAASKNPLDVTLVSEVRAVAPGQPFHLGLRLKAPAGFHSYWKNPGIVGLATRADWSLPEGFTAGAIQWPAPQLVKMADYTAQGYRGETLLIIPITPPATLDGPTVTLNAKVSWMCCSTSCHHANDVPFSITLPVAAAAEPDPTTAGLFRTERARVPRPDPAWSSSFERNGDTVTLTLTPAVPSTARKVADLGTIRFFTGDGQIDSDQPQGLTTGPGETVRLTLRLSDTGPKNPVGLPGVLHAENGWHQSGGPTHIEIQ